MSKPLYTDQAPLQINTALAKLVDLGPIKHWDAIRTNIILPQNPEESEPPNSKQPEKRCQAACCAVGNT